MPRQSRRDCPISPIHTRFLLHNFSAEYREAEYREVVKKETTCAGSKSSAVRTGAHWRLAASAGDGKRGDRRLSDLPGGRTHVSLAIPVPAATLSRDPRPREAQEGEMETEDTKQLRRHHVHENSVQKVIAAAVKRARLDKLASSHTLRLG